jgi:FkbM family methyltransferase
MANAQTFGYAWHQFAGSQLGLKWNRRDLPNLDRVVARVPQKRVALQAGGCLGIFPKRLAASFDTVYCFEPSPALFPLLCQNAPERNIIRFQAALGYDRHLVGVSQQRRDGKPDPHEGITHVSGAGPIPTMRIDDLGLPVCDLIQLDLEGFELYALHGATATLARCRPVLCIEINKSLGFMGIEKATVRSFIVAAGYRFVERLQSDEIFVPVEWT